MPACEPRVALLGPDLTPTENARVSIDSDGTVRIEPAVGDPDVLGRGLLVVPGFIDAHVHIGFFDPREVLTGGVTTVRDLAWPPEIVFDLARRSVDASFAGPRILAVGPMLTVAGGYPTRAAWAPAGTGRVLAGEDDARAAVRDLHAAGACAVKVALNAAAGPTLPAAVLEAIVDESHRHGLKVTGHVDGLDELVKAVDAGMDELAHMLMSDETIPDDLIVEMVRQGVAIVPTLSCRFGHGRTLAVDNLRRFLEAGGRVVYGTDLGNDGPRPGIDVLEVTAMAEAGMTALDIIRSATVTSAEWLGLDDSGVIADGRRADLIGVPLAALDDPRGLADVRLVIRGGRVLKGG